jgi:excisionase family DNA binding protein
MIEKFIVTNYDQNEFVSLIREAFREELKESLNQQEREIDFNILLTRKKVADLLKISLVTVSKYQRAGKLQYYRLGRHIYFKKGEIMKALEIPVKYRRWTDRRF